jgi:hypothetical protein
MDIGQPGRRGRAVATELGAGVPAFSAESSATQAARRELTGVSTTTPHARQMVAKRLAWREPNHDEAPRQLHRRLAADTRRTRKMPTAAIDLKSTCCSTAKRLIRFGEPGRIRTFDLLIKSQLLYH